MANFAVSYDLHKQRHYEAVWAKLESWGAVRLLESLWVVTMNSTASALRDDLQSSVDNDDSIIVVEIKPGSAWGTLRAPTPGVNWLKKNVG